VPALRWSSRARRELNAALAYIVDDDLERAAEVLKRIDQATEHLRDHPAIGRPGRIPGTRELVIPRTPYIAISAVERRVVRILAFHHTARDWPTEL